MRMTALDIQNHRFPRRFKGYDADEVEQFRAALVEDWAALCKEADGLRRRVDELEARLREITGQENALRAAMVTAQSVSDDLRRTAEHEAQMRVGQAELQAEKILAAAHRQASRLAQDVRELRTLRSRMSSSVRATIETHLALLEGFSRDPDEEIAEIPARLEVLAGRAAGTDLFGPPGPPVAAEEPAAPGAEAGGASHPSGPVRSATGWAVFVDQG